MRIHLGDIPNTPAGPPDAEGLHPIRGPRPSLGYLLAGLAGLFLLAAILGLIFFLTFVVLPAPVPPTAQAAPAPVQLPTPWAAIILTLLLSIPLHELLHLLWHPGWGLSASSVLVLWPAKLRFGVYYEGDMSRTRWLLMRLAPLAILSLLPAVLLTACPDMPLGHAARTAVEVLTTVNGVGSGGDVLAMLLVLFQVPASARLCFRSGRAYWQPARPPDR